MPPLADPEGIEKFPGAIDRVAGPRDLERYRDVFERGEVREEVERLEDEADVVRAELRQTLLIEPGDVGPGDLHGAGGRVIEPREQTKERGLAAARGSPDADDLPRRNFEVESAEDGEIPVAALDRLQESGCLDHHHGRQGSFRFVHSWRCLRERRSPREVP